MFFWGKLLWGIVMSIIPKYRNVKPKLNIQTKISLSFSICNMLPFHVLDLCLIPHPFQPNKTKNTEHQSVETNPSSWRSATRQWILHPPPWLQAPFMGKNGLVHKMTEYCPRKKGPCQKENESSSNHYSFRGYVSFTGEYKPENWRLLEILDIFNRTSHLHSWWIFQLAMLVFCDRKSRRVVWEVQVPFSCHVDMIKLSVPAIFLFSNVFSISCGEGRVNDFGS